MLGALELAADPLSDSDIELLLDSASSVRLVPVSAAETYGREVGGGASFSGG